MSSNNRHRTGYQEGERRRDGRYPVQVDLEYRTISGGASARGGVGRTVNISSSGVLFESGEALPPGIDLELSIAWPGPHGLKLCVTGLTVRTDDHGTAVEMREPAFVWFEEHHEFPGAIQ
jgi:hypothetical protein